MRALHGWMPALLFAAACGHDQFVDVTVTEAPCSFPVDSISVTVMNAGATAKAPVQFPVIGPFPQKFALEFSPDRSGMVSFQVDAFSAGQPVGTGNGSGTIGSTGAVTI